MNDIVAIVPYYGGGAERENCMLRSPAERRQLYVLKTLLNLVHFCDRVIVAVATDQDANHLRGIHPKIEVDLVHCYPFHLPAKLVNRIKHEPFDETYVLYTEADHIFHFSSLETVLGALDDRHYALPQRMDEIGPDDTFWHERGERIEIDQRHFVINNRVPEEVGQEGEYFYSPKTRFTAYSGAWLCRRKLLRRVEFSYDYFGLIVERVSGLNLFHADGTVPLKTVNVKDFWLEHLSGYFQHEKLAAENKGLNQS